MIRKDLKNQYKSGFLAEVFDRKNQTLVVKSADSTFDDEACRVMVERSLE